MGAGFAGMASCTFRGRTLSDDPRFSMGKENDENEGKLFLCPYVPL